eukprot:1156954-Pelagomonas_calceolata.AAC.8
MCNYGLVWSPPFFHAKLPTKFEYENTLLKTNSGIEDHGELLFGRVNQGSGEQAQVLASNLLSDPS